MNDLEKNTVCFESFNEAKNTLPNGWFFCCYVREQETQVVLENTEIQMNAQMNEQSFESAGQEVDFEIDKKVAEKKQPCFN